MQTKKIKQFPISQYCETGYATVQSVDDQYVLDNQSGQFSAIRAFSCMLKPEIGDKVIYSSDDNNQSYILSILHRPGQQSAKMNFEGDLLINSERGDISIASPGGLQFVSSQNIDLISDDLNVIAKKAVLNLDDTLAVGRKMTGNISRINLFAQSIDTVADRVTQKLQNSFRLISGIDQCKAGDILTTVKNLFSVRARQSSMLAKDDVKIDAKRIHMG